MHLYEMQNTNKLEKENKAITLIKKQTNMIFGIR